MATFYVLYVLTLFVSLVVVVVVVVACSGALVLVSGREILADLSRHQPVPHTVHNTHNTHTHTHSAQTVPQWRKATHSLYTLRCAVHSRVWLKGILSEIYDHC